MNPTRVMVVADQEVVSSGLVAVLEQLAGLSVGAGTVADPAIDEAHVVLYDVAALAEHDSRQLDQLVKEHDCAVLAVTRDLRPDLADVALEHGVDGCVSLGASAEVFAAAVEAAAWGDLHGSESIDAPDFTANPARAVGETELDELRTAGLTPREHDVLRLITRGSSNQEIADQLFLSINSVKTYVRSAYRRIGVDSRSQAVAWGVHHGLENGPRTEGDE
ncbi:LuxR C-terminal-related transcriptional regulator [Nocardioides sp. GXQ0305]|uniref:LuxR C-terminal-related transcriptional regulator n=1 Tax=Nocardioides sp. GXQ0305 TaxID=3423912 RepID=UPI003D7DAF20